MTETEQQFVARVRAELERLYGDRLRQLILFGSRARGDAHAGSDHDFMVVLDGLSDYWWEKDRLSELSLTLLVDLGADISVFPVTVEELTEQNLLMHEVRFEGMVL